MPHLRAAQVRLALAAAVLLGASAAHAQGACEGTPAGVRLRLQVTGVHPATGQVVMTVYPDDPKRFLAPRGKLARVRLPAHAPQTDGCFELPAAGRYAVAVYHDSNGDGRFGRTLVGLPAEGYGFSNDAPTVTGLPAFEKVRFPVKAGETTVRITMRYPH